MKKLTLAAAALVALTGSAIAADLPRKAPAAVAPAPLPVATWTGCYLTGGVGYGMWNQDNQAFMVVYRCRPNTLMVGAVGSAGSAAVATINSGRNSWSAR